MAKRLILSHAPERGWRRQVAGAERFDDCHLSSPGELPEGLPHRDRFWLGAGQFADGAVSAQLVDDLANGLKLMHGSKIPKLFGSTSPKSISWQRYLDDGKVPPMAGGRPDSNEAVSERLRLLRQVVSGESQTAFSARIGIDPKRWNNFERGMPLSKEVAILLVKKFPDVTLDWIYLGNENGLSVRRQREFAEAGKATTATPARSKARSG